MHEWPHVARGGELHARAQDMLGAIYVVITIAVLLTALGCTLLDAPPPPRAPRLGMRAVDREARFSAAHERA